MRLWRWVRATLALLGLVMLLALGSCFFTTLPWDLYNWLATDSFVLPKEPDYIVLLGGGGVPSESGLTRAFTAADQATRYSEAHVLLALPYDIDLESSAAGKMRNELILRGVEPERILIEPKGRNTREQALNVMAMIEEDLSEAAVIVVTSPEHMKRAIRSFRKAGFQNVAAASAFGSAIEMNLLYNPEDLGGRSLPFADGTKTMHVRYQFWNNIGYLGAAARELTALAYYWIKGWI